MFGPQQAACMPRSSFRAAGSPSMVTSGEPTITGPTPGCGHAGHPWASLEIWALSPSLDAAGTGPPGRTASVCLRNAGVNDRAHARRRSGLDEGGDPAAGALAQRTFAELVGELLEVGNAVEDYGLEAGVRRAQVKE